MFIEFNLEEIEFALSACVRRADELEQQENAQALGRHRRATWSAAAKLARAISHDFAEDYAMKAHAANRQC